VNTRRFGRTNWQVSEVGFGMWGMGSWSGRDDHEARGSLSRAVELGCNFFDTAWAYGRGRAPNTRRHTMRGARPDLPGIARGRWESTIKPGVRAAGSPGTQGRAPAVDAHAADAQPVRRLGAPVQEPGRTAYVDSYGYAYLDRDGAIGGLRTNETHLNGWNP
jgi:hypothetical protein